MYFFPVHYLDLVSCDSCYLIQLLLSLCYFTSVISRLFLLVGITFLGLLIYVSCIRCLGLLPGFRFCLFGTVTFVSFWQFIFHQVVSVSWYHLFGTIISVSCISCLTLLAALSCISCLGLLASVSCLGLLALVSFCQVVSISWYQIVSIALLNFVCYFSFCLCKGSG